MKFSYNWLNEYFNKKLPPAPILAEKIGLHSFELEGIEKTENGDFLIDWDILPNRSSDCLSYDGLVQEIASVLNIPTPDVLEPTKAIKFDNSFRTSDYIKLKIKEKEKVLRATKRIALDVKVGPSPKWLIEKLETMGQKSINNVVDITNYVMWVTGQPVHAFDYDKLAGKEPKNIYIKTAKNGEKIIDLSGEEHELNDKILVIADDEKSLDIAGVKGGNVSGIDINTTRVLMSAVNFEYENIRNTSRKLKLQTDASKRYENEVPLYKVERAQKLFSYLLQKLADARVSNEMIDLKNQEEKEKDISIKVSLEEINSLLGLDLKKEEVESIFKRQNFSNKTEKIMSKTFFTVKPTKNRLDLKIKEDLIEEVGRIYGYENIPLKFPTEEFNLPPKNIVKENKNIISDLLTSLGFFEVLNRTIVKNGKVGLVNSINSQATTIRNNLLENLLEKTKKNITHSPEPKMFEFGKIFIGIENSMVKEHYSFAGVVGKKKIKEKAKKEVFYQTKGVLEKIFETLNIKNIYWKKTDGKDFIANIIIDEEKIGSLGINFWEINLEKLVAKIKPIIGYQKPSKYPKIERDIAFWVPLDYRVSEAKTLIEKLLPKEALDLKLFDIYEDLENNRKSLAFNIIFQSQEKTLSDEFANEAMDKIYKKLKKNKFEIR